MRITFDLSPKFDPQGISYSMGRQLDIIFAVARIVGPQHVSLLCLGDDRLALLMLRQRLEGTCLENNTVVWSTCRPNSDNSSLAALDQVLRSFAIASVSPDIVHSFEPSSISTYRSKMLSRVRFSASVSPSRALQAASRDFAELDDFDFLYWEENATLTSLRQSLKDRSRSAYSNETEASARELVFWWQSLKGGLTQDEKKTKETATIALVTPYPPEKTGIADYSALLASALGAAVDVTIVVGEFHQKDSPPSLKTVSWFKKNYSDFDYIVYQFGNSPAHAFMMNLIQNIPGIVDLHDIFLGDYFYWQSQADPDAPTLADVLVGAHGVQALVLLHDSVQQAIKTYPCTPEILKFATGVIVHSEYSKDFLIRLFGESVEEHIEVLPVYVAKRVKKEKLVAKRELGIAEDEILVCTFGFVNPNKLSLPLFEAVALWANGKKVRLAFVGSNDPGVYGKKLRHAMATEDRLVTSITGYVSSEQYTNFLSACDVAIQLRTETRGETSAAAMDCLVNGIPTIVSDEGPMAELLNYGAVLVSNANLQEDLSNSLDKVLRGSVIDEDFGEARRRISERTSIAEQYFGALASLTSTNTQPVGDLLEESSELLTGAKDLELEAFALAFAKTWRPIFHRKRVFLDVTNTAKSPLRTGIERVASKFASYLATTDFGPIFTPVELVERANGTFIYKVSRSFYKEFLDLKVPAVANSVEPCSGDIVVCLDFSGSIFFRADLQGFFTNLRESGVSLASIVYDLLPCEMPEYFPPGADLTHSKWLEIVAKFDLLMPISSAVKQSLENWFHDKKIIDRPQLKVVPMGFDIQDGLTTNTSNEELDVSLLQDYFLMVGTIEPRKGHAEVLDTFEALWAQGWEKKLVIAGREGWKQLTDDHRRSLPALVKRIQQHSELGRRLFWLDDLDDVRLASIQRGASALIMASHGEGFGLPLIEAASLGVPVLARDIPVFKEVAARGTQYFDSTNFSAILRNATESKLDAPEVIDAKTWKEASEILRVLLTSFT